MFRSPNVDAPADERDLETEHGRASEAPAYERAGQPITRDRAESSPGPRLSGRFLVRLVRRQGQEGPGDDRLQAAISQALVDEPLS